MRPSFLKRFLFVAVLISLFTPTILFAQYTESNSRQGNFYIGAEGGIQFTNVQNFSPNYDYEARGRVGFTAGAFAAYYVSNSFKLKAGLSYDNRKFNYFTQGTFLIIDTSDVIKSYLYGYDVDYSVNYLTIPLGISFEKGSEKFSVMIQVNFYYSIYLNSSMDGTELYYFDPAQGVDLSGTILNQGYSTFILDGATTGIARTNTASSRREELQVWDFNSNDIGFNIFVGGAYHMTRKLDLFLNLGFSYSMGHLFEDPQIDTKWIQITRINAGISYKLGRD